MARDFVFVSPLTSTAATPMCCGDCNSDSRVTIDELTRAVNCALGSTAVDCGNCRVDSDASGAITVDELVDAVGHALHGCPAP